MYNSSQMATTLRAITSVTLSIWISALACLAGCGQTFVSSRMVDANSDQIALTEMPGCHHSNSSTPGDQKKQDASTISCCLPDAISQKTAADLSINVTYATLVSGVAPAIEDQSYPPTENPLHVRLHGGRETILQTHLLRI